MSPQSGKKDLDVRRDLDGKRGLDDKKGPNGKKDLEHEVERLTVPERSLFEDAAAATPAALLGTPRAPPLPAAGPRGRRPCITRPPVPAGRPVPQPAC